MLRPPLLLALATLVSPGSFGLDCLNVDAAIGHELAVARSRPVKPRVPRAEPNPVDPVQLERWVEAHPAETKPIARAIAKNIKRVAQGEFEQNLHRMLDKFAVEMAHEPTLTLVEHEEGGSSKWVTDLAVEYLGEKYPALAKKIRRVTVDEAVEMGKRGDLSRIAILDDASYSGGQIGITLNYLQTKGGVKAFDVLVPYLTQRAIKHIKTGYPKSAESERHLYEQEIPETMRQALAREGIAESEIERLFGTYADRPLLYFDWTIPDSASGPSVQESPGYNSGVRSRILEGAVIGNDGVRSGIVPFIREAKPKKPYSAPW